RQAELLGALDAAVEGDPHHRLRVGEVPGLAAHFPDAAVGLLPDRLEMGEQRALQIPAGVACGEAARAPLVQRVHHFADDVELELASAALPMRTGREPS